MIFYGSVILIIFTSLRYTNNVNFAKNTTPVFFLKTTTDTDTVYNVAGVVKPGSINIIKGTDELSFILTDFEHEFRVFYKGLIPPAFLEGNTAIVSGYITDPKKPTVFIANTLLCDHSYNSEKWISMFGYLFF